MRNLLLFGFLVILAAACTPATAVAPPPEQPSDPTQTISSPAPIASEPPTALSPTATPLPTSTSLPPTPTFTPLPVGDGIHWTKHPANPVLDVGPEGAWDDTLVGEPRVLRTADGFQMIFVGFDGTKEGSKFSSFYGYSLGLANSGDGIAWARPASNPIVALAGQEFGMLWHGAVVEQGQYMLYYTLGSARGGRSGLRIYRAVSADGVTWAADQKPVIDLGARGSYDDYDAYAPTILFEEGLYKMWYTASKEKAGSSIAYATSPDGVTWTKYEGNPVLAEKGAYYPSVLKVNGIYWMWYSLLDKSDPGHLAIHLATSPDGIAWTLHPDGPVLKHGQEGEWDSGSVLEPSVYFDGRVFHMWFTGSSGHFQEKIGYATSP